MSPARLSTAKSSFTRADDLVLGLEQHLVVGIVGDRAAGGQRGQPRAAPAAQHVVDARRGGSARRAGRAGAEAFRQHGDDGGEILARQRAVGPGAAHQRVELVLAPFAAPRPRRRSAAPARRAAAREWRAGRARRGGRCRAAPRIPPARRARAGTAGPWACRRPRGRSGRPAAGSSRSSAASRAGRPGRPRRYRCRARARRSPPAPRAAEQRLKHGKLKALVATASLELGIDIGDVDLVCQLGSPRSIATLPAAGRALGPRGRRHAQGPAVSALARRAGGMRGAASTASAAASSTGWRSRSSRSTCWRSRSSPRWRRANGARTSCSR